MEQNALQEPEEYCFTGYCKKKNMTSIMTGKYSLESYGLCLEQILGCDYLKCEYNKDCTIVKQALAKEDE